MTQSGVSYEGIGGICKDSMADFDEAAVNQWSVVKASGQPPKQRSLHVGVVCGPALWIFGGYDGANRVNDFYKFDFQTMKWSEIIARGETQPSARDRHVAVAHKTSIYIFGGYDGSNRTNDFWEYDIEVNEWRPVDNVQGPAPTPRHSHSGVEYQDSMYIFAGYDGNYRADFHQFNFDHGDRRWTTINVKGSTPKARYRTSAVVYRNKMLVFGGHDGAKHLNDFYEFNFDTSVWTQLAAGPKTPPSPRDSHIAVIHGNNMFLFGGSTVTARNDLFKYAIEEEVWEEILPSGQVGAKSSHGSHAPPCPRFCHTGAVCNSSLYVFGGYDGQHRLNDFRCFKLAEEINVQIPNSSLVEDLRAHLDDASFSDVTFIVEGQRVHAHKLLLARCSYFRAMFESKMRESEEKEIVIHNVSHPVFKVLLEYLYTDNIEIPFNMAMELFSAADQFGVERLKKMCERTILTSINVENSATILQAADSHNAAGLRKSCIDFIMRHFDAVSKTTAFEEMGRANVGLIFEILKNRS